MHQKIKKQFELYEIKLVRVPNWISFETNLERRTFFDRHPALESAVGKNCEIPTSTLVAERISPLPQPTRLAMIYKYCPQHAVQSAIESPGNKDCIVRVHLGCMRGRLDGSQPAAGGRPIRWFSLRNFPLHLNQMDSLNMDVSALAHKMGTAMAVLHWAAKTDARDVEFVLGSSSKEIPGHTNPTTTEDLLFNTTDFWVLDFNQVQPIILDAAGVMQAVQAAKMNDPYIPKPKQGSDIEKKAWNRFVEGYLAQSHVIPTTNKSYSSSEHFALPRIFIEGLIGK